MTQFLDNIMEKVCSSRSSSFVSILVLDIINFKLGSPNMEFSRTSRKQKLLLGKILALNFEKSNIYQTTKPHLQQKISKHGSIQHYFSPSKKVKLKIWSTFSPTHQNICQRSSTLASSTLDLPHIRKVHMCDFQNFGLIFEEQYFFPLKRCVVF